MRQRGQSTLEIIIALAILALSISAVIMVAFGNQRVSVNLELSNQALHLARKELEAARATAEQDFNALVTSSSTEGVFSKEQIVEAIDANQKKVTTRISWDTEPLVNEKVELVTIVTNWEDIDASGGDTGGGGLSGDWKNPRSLGSVDLGPGNEATDLDVLSKIVYLTAEASDPKKHDFFIVDANDGQNPFIKSSIDTGPGPCPPNANCGPGLNALDVAGSYAYVSGDDTNRQLQVINVSDLNNPSVTASFKLPGVSGSGAVGWSIFYWNERIYIGTKQASGPEFHIIDVSNPSVPSSLGSREIGANVNMIHVKGTTAYLATSDDSKELLILNVSDPANISELGSYNASGGDDGRSVYLVGTKLYLGRAGEGELLVLNVSDPASVTLLGSKDIDDAVNGIVVRDYLAFLGTTDSNQEFQVWNISDPANIDFWSSLNFAQVATGIDYENNLVYVSVRSNDALRIITSSP